MGFSTSSDITFYGINEDEKIEIQNKLKEDYNFYVRVMRVLTKNNRNFKLLLYIDSIIQSIVYQYDKYIK